MAMVALAVFATGVSVAMAFFYLVRGVTGFAPGFDRTTLDRVGIVAALAIFCLTGPAILARSLGRSVPDTMLATLRLTLVFSVLIMGWAVALGVLAMESARGFL